MVTFSSSSALSITPCTRPRVWGSQLYHRQYTPQRTSYKLYVGHATLSVPQECSPEAVPPLQPSSSSLHPAQSYLWNRIHAPLTHNMTLKGKPQHFIHHNEFLTMLATCAGCMCGGVTGWRLTGVAWQWPAGHWG